MAALNMNDSRRVEVAVVGSTMVDLVAYGPSLPLRGETVFGSSFAKNFGGKGSNQAVQCARLGACVTHIGQVGDDSLGQEYMDQLVAEGIDTRFMRRSIGKSTGIAVINVETTTGANTIVIIPGANDDLVLTDDAIDHIQKANVLITQNEVPRTTTLKALQAARVVGRTIAIFNPAPVSEGLQEVIATSDIVVPNETELSALTGLPTTNDGEIEVAAAKLLKMGCRVVIATLGENGAYVTATDGFSSTRSGSGESGRSEGVFLRAEKVTAVDSTGAGDSFIGTLASNLARGATLLLAVRNALHCATISVTRVGAQKSYATLQEIPIDYLPPPLPPAESGILAFDKEVILRID